MSGRDTYIHAADDLRVICPGGAFLSPSGTTGPSLMMFRKLALAAAVFMGCVGVSHASTEEDAALKTVNDFLSAITRRDKAAMLSEAVPHMEVMSARANAEGGLRRLTIEQIADLIVAQPPGKMVQTLHHPVVHVDNDLASVWSPYTWTDDGHFSHCASEEFSLLKLNGKWLMVGVADTARTDEKTCLN